MDAFQNGDRVRLSPTGRLAFKNSLKKLRVDWNNRRGTLHHVTTNKAYAHVTWDGTDYEDQLPIKAVEKCDDAKSK
jgi:hypothetical protein